MKTYTLNNFKISVHEQGTDGPIILWGMYPHQGNEIEHLIECLADVVADHSFVLAAFQANDWNADFSPWAAEGTFEGQSFAGKGPETLKWLTESFIPQLRVDYGNDRPLYFIGYSLAGLFAMWAAYETDAFDGIACCSGSLWFEDWDKYLEGKYVGKSCDVYLSLGGKEEKTNNVAMARVGDRTRQQEKILQADENAEHVILEWNSGGHFADSGKRLAKGIKWLLSVNSK